MKTKEENREVNRVASRRWHQRKFAESKDGYTYVYYLPEEHYVGITTSISNRMKSHKRTKIVDGMEILARFERHVDAHLFETMLHQRGYNGYSHKLKTN